MYVHVNNVDLLLSRITQKIITMLITGANPTLIGYV